ncbi:MAG: ankyrin repeat domain-containing protein [Rickettsiaceae bacterium]|nr:ankyrin repeat domain-containing protein [Rickettsiaceae bacterium]
MTKYSTSQDLNNQSLAEFHELGSELMTEIQKHESSIEKIHALLERGVSVNYATYYGLTPLYAACSKGKLEIAKLLIDKGADVNMKDNVFRESPLHLACAEGREGMVNLLLSSNATVDLLLLLAISHDNINPNLIANVDRISTLQNLTENDHIIFLIRNDRARILDLLQFESKLEDHIRAIGENGEEISLHFHSNDAYILK